MVILGRVNFYRQYNMIKWDLSYVRTEKIFFMICLLTFLGLGTIGCEKEGPAERTGEKFDEAAEQVGEKVEEFKEKTGEQMEEAGEKMQ